MMRSVEELRNLCDRCLGRVFAKRGHGLGNKERGRSVRIFYAMVKNVDINEILGAEEKDCKICKGIFLNIDKYAEMITKSLEGYEFRTFVVGSRFPKEVEEEERLIQEEFGGEGESIRNEFNREIGKKLLEIWKDRDVDLKNPEMTIIVDTVYDTIEINPKPLYIYGRYRKLIRGIPQTRWSKYPEKKKYETSVEELIAKKVMDYTEGEDHVFHGMGREDIDARMLGNGRPFVLEIKKPKKRFIDLKMLEKEINEYCSGKVEVSSLRFATWRDVEQIKNAKSSKRYRVKIEFSQEVDENSLKKAIEELRGKVIYQRTPLRVSHRRADKVRKRKVEDIKLVEHYGKSAVLEITAESGMYIKELMHGDKGRTKPNLAEKIGINVSVVYLDVIEILNGGDNNGGNVPWT